MSHIKKCSCGVIVSSDFPGQWRCVCGAMITLEALKPSQSSEAMPQLPSRGLGDTIHKITSFLHIPQCGGCKQRQQTLNEMFPYKGKET